MKNLGLSSTSDVITFDQNWHHPCSTSAAGKDLSSGAKIRVIGRMEPEICTKMLKKLSPKILPCGTPTVIGAATKSASPTDVLCFLFVRYDWNQFRVSSESPTDLTLEVKGYGQLIERLQRFFIFFYPLCLLCVCVCVCASFNYVKIV